MCKKNNQVFLLQVVVTPRQTRREREKRKLEPLLQKKERRVITTHNSRQVFPKESEEETKQVPYSKFSRDATTFVCIFQSATTVECTVYVL